MLTVNELKDGKCLIVAQHGEKVKRFEGYYKSRLNVVFMTIPSFYNIIGYEQ